jgi:hypothetical protein
MGTAETPAEPMSGFTGEPGESLFMSLAASTPAAVETPKATTPRAMILRVVGARKLSARMVMPTLTPRKMVRMLMTSFWADLTRRSVTAHSRRKLPSMSMATRGEASGTRSTQTTSTPVAKRSFSRRETLRRDGMRMRRSRSVVSRRMMGGWMRGTRAM